MATKIEWTDETWNPVTGCVKVSPGCKHCYAQTFSERFRGVVSPGGTLHPFHPGFDPTLRPERVEQPLKWRKPRRVFVNSMSDLFGEFVPDDYIAEIFAIMSQTPQHTYQVLTKRADRMLDWTKAHDWIGKAANIWVGVSAENKTHGLPRVRKLRRAPVAVRFVSFEPLLEDLGQFNLCGIDWAIVGGESGPHARPMKPEWVRRIRNQCTRHGVPFFFKQWGGTRKHKTGRVLDGRTWDEFPSLI